MSGLFLNNSSITKPNILLLFIVILACNFHRSGRAASCILQQGETDNITPIEAEDRAGLRNNKNWKKSLFTDHQV